MTRVSLGAGPARGCGGVGSIKAGRSILSLAASRPCGPDARPLAGRALRTTDWARKPGLSISWLARASCNPGTPSSYCSTCCAYRTWRHRHGGPPCQCRSGRGACWWTACPPCCAWRRSCAGSVAGRPDRGGARSRTKSQRTGSARPRPAARGGGRGIITRGHRRRGG